MPGDGVQLGLGLAESDLGIGNRLQLLPEDLLANLNKVQTRHGLRPSETLVSRDFTVEMETGTGKTYVYLRTVFELNKRFGFTKFVIVVPSVAIKEGVYKSLQIMAPHFLSLYSGQPFEYFLYDSSKLNQVSFLASVRALVPSVTTAARALVHSVSMMPARSTGSWLSSGSPIVRSGASSSTSLRRVSFSGRTGPMIRGGYVRPSGAPMNSSVS